ncbi:hypothetical protein [Bathymodiolus platifrons methanotrophic gill symbiont]|nr:hypothetical protein [Bathymodiolus platifrons methanotrophic gill symbiont]
MHIPKEAVELAKEVSTPESIIAELECHLHTLSNDFGLITAKELLTVT